MKLLTPSLLLICSIASACGTAESDDGDVPTTTAATSESGDDSAGEDDTPGAEAGGSADADSGDDPAGSGPDPTAADDATAESGDAPDQLPPRSHAELVPWLQADSYAQWHAESGVHVSAGPHGDGVRTFLNDALFDSLDAGNATHPEGAAVVKELYANGEISGWAVMIKVADGGPDGWYWYESIGQSIYADGTEVDLCTGCHAIGADYVRTPFPLQ